MKRHPLHSMCSYLGSFPPHVPRQILNRWYPRTRILLDPFCGGGTTLLEAGLLGYGTTIGIDRNPLAVALSRAKIQAPSLSDALSRINELAREFAPDVEVLDVPPAVSQLFHCRTLQQLVYLREVLDASRQEDAFIIGALLGILHGKFRRDGSSAYLSIDMPNTFSMSPEYVRKFVEKNGLERPRADVFSKLRDRVEWLLRGGSIHTGRHLVLQGDGARLDKVLSAAGITYVGGIVTSPPYLGVLRYGAFNWIRLWFLKEEAAEVDRALDSTDSLDKYFSFVASFLGSAARVLRRRGLVTLVVGDVQERGQNLNLASRIWEELSGVVPFHLEELSVDNFDSSGKTTRIWGEERKGRATEKDRILVLRKR